MKWIIKALAQKVFSALPNGEQINYKFQRATGGLPVSDDEFVEKVRLAHERLKRYETFGPKRPIGEIACFEFGAGWDLIGPLSYYAFGVRHQTVIDIRPNLHLELVNDSIAKFAKNMAACQAVTGRTLGMLPPGPCVSADDLARRFGIIYKAPCDAAETGLASLSIDFISTNSTLEHIPGQDLPAIMRESKRILKDDGVMCHFTDMKDHFSYFDHSITKYNFLTLSDGMWSLLNSPIANQNRLRYKDYQKIFADAELRVLSEEIEQATPQDISDIARLPLNARFAGTDTTEHLAAHIIRDVLVKA